MNAEAFSFIVFIYAGGSAGSKSFIGGGIVNVGETREGFLYYYLPGL